MFDSLLRRIGEFGSGQRRLYVLLSLPATYNAVIGILVAVFLFDVPLHRCAIPQMKNDTYAVQGRLHAALINFTIPKNSDFNGANEYSHCEVYVISNETHISLNETSVSLQLHLNETRSCDRWVYDKNVYISTVSQSFDFVCSRKSFSTYAKSIAMAGNLMGLLVSGPLSDRFGRRKVIIGSMGFSILFSICFSWVNNLYLLFALVPLITGCLTTQYTTCFVYSMEVIGPSKRMLTGVAMNLFWSAGNLVVSLFAFLLREWRIRHMVLSFPGVLFAYLYFIPESPRWLLSRGRIREAKKTILKIAKENKVTIGSDPCLEAVTDSEIPREQFWVLLKSSVMLKRLLIVGYNWFSIGMCFYGLSMNVTNLSGDIYLNFFLFVIVEACAYLICLFIIKRIKRRFLLCGSMLFAGTSCILTFIPFLVSRKPEKWIVNTLACLGNTCVSAGFAAVYVYTAEIMPTTSRNFGIGICSILCRMGSILAPFINDLTLHVTGRYSQILPMLIFGGVTALAGLLALLLPETQNRRLPESIHEAEGLGAKQTSTEMECVPDLDVEMESMVT